MARAALSSEPAAAPPPDAARPNAPRPNAARANAPRPNAPRPNAARPNAARASAPRPNAPRVDASPSASLPPNMILPSAAAPPSADAPPKAVIRAAQALQRRVLTLLTRERASHGHGSAAEIDLRIGRSEGYLARILREEIGLQMDMLFRILYALQVDPSSFFARVMGLRVEPATCLQRLQRLLVDRPERPVVPLAKGAWQLLRRLAKKTSKPWQQPADEALAELPWLADLTTLDNRRFDAPAALPEAMGDLLRRALSHAKGAPQSAPARRALARALGVAASIERQHGARRRAARLLHNAWSLCQDSPSTLHAELLERASYLFGEHGDHETATEMARQGTEIYLRFGHLQGVGRCFVARAVMAYHRNQPQDALELYRAALRYLPPTAWQNRFAAFQGMGLCRLQLDELGEAATCADQATDLHTTRRGGPWWRLVWLQAELAYRNGDLQQAETLYRQCKDAFAEVGVPIDEALLAVHLAKVLLAARKMEELRHVAASSMALLKPLKPHAKACAVLHDLARRALTGELTLHWLEGASQSLDTFCGQGAR